MLGKLGRCQFGDCPALGMAEAAPEELRGQGFEQ